ncbi:MAG: NADH-quinone oxidoreductase subunit F [Actinobacteria bacterium HGW-Actinobacteria-7]|nr:MAG: NADH-quinone oxidoreductase subunit F [Actinobacteria bacterium HGW-Actinobacteria-7]
MAPDTSTPRAAYEVRVCAGSACVANGSLQIAQRFEEAIARNGLAGSVRVIKTGCHGLCARGPVVVVGPDGVFYPAVDLDAADRIIVSVLGDREPVEPLLFRESPGADSIARYADVPFNARQQRIVLRNCGVIDPESLDSAFAAGDYVALSTALATMTPEQVIEMVRDSGLRGRGGAGFSTGMKWQLARAAEGDLKYLCCNADEGDPGAFMDRAVLEGDPHAVLEGMALAAYAIGASEGYVYVRAEYPLAVKRLRKAIADAEARGLLGKDIMGSGFSYSVSIREGAGAFVCGEETALIASVEGRRGMPRPRPPFPTTSGLWNRPTCINNVETLANIPWIVANGAEAYAAIGTGNSKGTKVFALTGHVHYTGLVEVPMGLTVREMVHEIGGGSSSERPIKAVQIGGPSGGCLPASLFDTHIDYDALASVGAVVGSGGLVAVDKSTCMVEFARYFLAFTQDESCGKCVPCRIGTKRMLEIVTRITEGHGQPGDIETLERLGNLVRSTSLCALGGTAANPVLTTLKYFREEYEEHISEKKCRAHACGALSTYAVIPEKCKGCGVCKKNCPVNAISSVIKEQYTIDPDTCVKCGICEAKCPFDAIIRV